MKIGYLLQAGVPDIRSDPPSGPAIHVTRVIEELGKLGHQVRLLAYMDHKLWKSDNMLDFIPVIVPSIDKGILRWIERCVRRIQHDLKLPYAAFFESLRFALACEQELRDYDLFYERMGWFGYGGGLAARWLKVPLILEVNGDPLTEMEVHGMKVPSAQRRLSVALLKKATGWASHTVVAGQGCRNRHIERWSVDPQKVTVVENGSELVSLLSQSQLRAFNPDSDHDDLTTIAYLGGFDPWQGVTILIRAVARVFADQIPARLILIGSGVGVQEARQLVQELGLEPHVTFTGRLAPHEYGTCLANADIGVSPYCGWYEFSGLKLMDYKSAGLAIIASGKDGQPAIIDQGRTGLVVPPCDEDTLYRTIKRLCTDRDLLRNMGRACRMEAERLHSWKNTAQQLNSLFEQVITQFHHN